uniref:Uncharacterized protein n=1 Tax=Peronospora matthiolae TaxID=2874970 RepID=A0AAV1UMB4_9STRA
MAGRPISALMLPFNRMPAMGNRKCALAEYKHCGKTFAWGAQGFHRLANNDNCPGVRQSSLAFPMLLSADLITILPVIERLGLLPVGRISYQYVSDEEIEQIEVRPSKRPPLLSSMRTSFTTTALCDSITVNDRNEADELLACTMHCPAESNTLLKGDHWKAWLTKIRPSHRFPEPDAIGGQLLNIEYIFA